MFRAESQHANVEVTEGSTVEEAESENECLADALRKKTLGSKGRQRLGGAPRH